MKTRQTVIALMSLSLLAGCGEYSKNPVADIEEMRNQGKSEIQMGPYKPQEITKEIVVVQKEPVYIAQSKIDQSAIVLTPEPQMFFNEGKSSQFKIRANILVPNVKFKLNVSGLNGATVTESESEKGTFLLTWTPPLYSVPAEAAFKPILAKASIEILSGSDQAQVNTLKSLILFQDFSVIISRNQEVPSELEVQGLNAEVNEDTLTPISITVKVPGVDKNSPTKPTLMFRYDGVIHTAGNNFQELDGTRHIIMDKTKLEAQYLGDFKWKFERVFDTKNIQVQPQTAQDGSLLKNADGTRLRLSVKVISPNNTATPEKLLQVKVRYNKSVTAPRFDLSGIGADSLTVARGQKITLNFYVESADATAAVKVEQAKSALPGTLNMTCKDSSTGAAKQACTLNWDVPCDTQDSKLNGEIAMTAISVINGRNSDISSYKLKVVADKEDKKLCNTEAK